MPANEEFFAGKVAVITGSSTGIGLGLSRQLLECGAEVYMSGRTPEHIAQAAESLRRFGDRVHAQVLDVRDEEATADYMDYVAARGSVDYLFCNAGVGYSGFYVDAEREDWNRIFDANVFGVVNSVHFMLPHLVRQGHGHISITSSVAGIAPLPYQTIYVASKYAVFGFARCLKYEMEEKNIQVSVICPGAVATEIFQRRPDYLLDRGLPPPPPNAIDIDRAGREILDGIRNGQEIIPVNDDARQLYKALQEGDATTVEAWLQAAGDMNLKRIDECRAIANQREEKQRAAGASAVTSA